MRMTGKDLVFFIINHNLLNEEIDGSKLSEPFCTLEETAVKLGISTTSLEELAKIKMIDYVVFDDKMYFHKDVQLASLKRR